MPPAEEPEEMPLPSDPKVIFLGGLFVLALLAAAYVATRDRVAIGLCCRSQAPAAASVAPIGAVARTADTRGAAADPCAIRNDRRLGCGHFRPCSHLGSQASRGHSSASGAVEFHARTHQYTATVFAAGGEFWRNGTITKCRRLGARPNSSDEAIHRDPKFCQRLLYDGAVSFFPTRVWRYLPAAPRRDNAALQQQAPGRRNLAADRKRHLRVSGHDHDHERGSRYRYGDWRCGSRGWATQSSGGRWPFC